MIAPLITLAAAAAAPVDVRSDLVTDEHSHVWTQIVDAPGNAAFLDVAFRGQAEVGGVMFPVVLLRYQRGMEAGEETVSDFRTAIDCKAGAMAALEVSYLTAAFGPNGIRVGRREALPSRFTPAYRENEARVAPVFKHACGPQWSMELSE